MAAPLPGDKKAGFMGLIIGGIAVFLIAWGIVHLTNKKYEGEKAGAATTTEQAGHESLALGSRCCGMSEKRPAGGRALLVWGLR